MGTSQYACQFCGRQPETVIDGRTTQGVWAWMCEVCHKVHGIGIGAGKGQKYQISETGHLKKLEG